MSAWLVGKTHIDLLITAAIAWNLLEVDQDPDRAGLILWAACQSSISYRYPDDGDGDWPGPDGLTLADIGAYTFQAIEGRVDPAVIEEAVASYRYQSCEHPSWATSEAHLLSHRLLEAAQSRLDRYDTQWGACPHVTTGAWDVDNPEILLNAQMIREHAKANT